MFPQQLRTIRISSNAHQSFDASITRHSFAEVPVIRELLGPGPRFAGKKHEACQHLQIAVEFSERDLERYQEFEGEQPDVLERINSNPKKLEG
jgi:hypothetical protein